MCGLSNQALDAEECDVVACDHCRQRVSLDSSRSTRGGSEVPRPKVNLLNERGAFPLYETKGIIKSVRKKFKAVFGKGKENKGLETENPDCIFHLDFLKSGIISLILDATIGIIRNGGLVLSLSKPEVVYDHSYLYVLQRVCSASSGTLFIAVCFLQLLNWILTKRSEYKITYRDSKGTIKCTRSKSTITDYHAKVINIISCQHHHVPEFFDL